MRILQIALLIGVTAVALCGGDLLADPPSTMYIFPAGGQRGTEVKVRVGGLYLHDECPFEMLGPGVRVSPKLTRTKTVWFEGPVIPLPDSQQQEDYPKDMAGTVTLAPDAILGTRAWRTWTAQGACSARTFLVGDFPEVVEDEIDGEPIPVKVTLPVTANGRIFPREDVDVWTFDAKAGQGINCAAVAAKLGNPLDVRLEVRDPAGRRLAESGETSPPGFDALVRFTAPADGPYQVRIHDARFSGLQHYVYRLTITAGPFVDRVYPLGGRRGTTTRFQVAGQSVPAEFDMALPANGSAVWQTTLPGNAGSNLFSLDLDDLPETLEAEPNDKPEQAAPRDVPAVFNGRIDRPGDADVWSFRAAKGAPFQIDLRAARLGSPLDSVLTLLDAGGKELAKSDDLGGNQTDSELKFTAPADGVYSLRVEERLESRGGPAYAYRLRVAPPPAPDFRLKLVADALSVNRAGEAKLKLRAERIGGFAGEIKLAFDNLPAGVSVANPAIPANAAEVDLTFKADAKAPVQAAPIAIKGTAMIGDKPVTQRAAFRLAGTDETEIDTLLLAVCVPTPFKVKGVYEVKYAARGGEFVRRFTIERNGFEGPLEVRLGDKQARHLQGVTGPTITVPAGVSEFDYPVYLPPWMEIGRTSRTVVMAAGEVADPGGAKHKVSFTSVNQNEQIVALVDPGPLSVDLGRKSVGAVAGADATIEFRVGRGTGVTGPVRVELVVPGHVRGVSADPVEIPADAQAGTLRLRFAAGDLGPFNMPAIVRATGKKRDGSPAVDEAKVELVPR